MQELIDRIKQLKYSEINEQAWDAYDAVMDLAESLLEKEKEQMCEFAEQYFISFGYKSTEDYFDRAFNTKER